MEEENVVIPMDYLASIITKLLSFTKGQEGPLLTASEIVDVVTGATQVFEKEPSLIELDAPVNIVGDVHGSYFDMVKLLTKTTLPSAPFLFLGDYIDRGDFGIEVICLLYALKIRSPKQIFLLRGNHESYDVSSNTKNSFLRQCALYYDKSIVLTIFKSFQYLPFCCLVSKTMLCLHGGISPELSSLQQLRDIKRPVEIPTSGLLCDLVWSDPLLTPDIAPNLPNTSNSKGFVRNEVRGVSYFFDDNVLDVFLKANGLKVLCRGHQCVDGFKFSPEKKCLTVFSCSGGMKNRAGLLVVPQNLKCQFIYL
ncbi:serine/threonine protein phosphatase PP1 isozyme, putative [Entamoeba invadens IP1]|uniref:serine/threonine protein phosphatase PP1 isozyme, putative n=1 Tax=Entamoeba invadens IP1 TaxID=370355 RepID=UPI0002C3E98C|nr:serine/threonine protein phosphatase PP1 isozyme, putative [Entamoeba invadens IP1]ELP94247.1 serine/threonine protein phosphatase PP1 isozyme, putative [Entamoeba invadens IP1]|eukprot:XP_004261018.1 serine/threonine protein phosphatase PP1 isozyme, putative [Entamoeba invadens IP1]